MVRGEGERWQEGGREMVRGRERDGKRGGERCMVRGVL